MEGVEVNLPTVYSWSELFVIMGWSPNVRYSRSDGTSDSFLIGNRMPGVLFRKPLLFEVPQPSIVVKVTRMCKTELEMFTKRHISRRKKPRGKI